MNNQNEEIYLLNPTVEQGAGLLQKFAENSPVNQVNLENVEDFSSVCRTCAAITDLVVPVFSGEGLQNNLADKINRHLPINVSETDELPLSVCEQCAHTLLAWHELTACCVQADVALRTRLAQLKACQDQKPARASEGQVVDRSQQNELEGSEAMPAVPPPEYPRSDTPRLVSCKYCPEQQPEDSYRAHLEAEHLDLVFHCDECISYVDRKDVILHMGMHVLQHSFQKERQQNEALDRIQIASSDNNNRRVSTDNKQTPNYNKTTTRHNDPKTNKNRNMESKKEIKQEKVKTEPNAETIKSEKSNKVIETVTPSVVELPLSEPTTAPIPETLTQKLNTEVISNNSSTNNNYNEFSDHSDMDEFSPLPDSVFEAIEDTQDSQSSDTDLEPRQDTDNDSENKSPENNSKKNSKRTRVCPICSKVYTAASSYFYHVKYSHQGAKEHECEVCKRKFGTRGLLNQHMSTHADHCDYECKVCGKRFRSNASLYIHEQSHNGVKTYSCDRCDLSFRWRTHLMRHMKRHAAEKHHVCETCGRGFTIHCDLLRHARTHQAGDYKCAQCGHKFAQLRYLKVHMDNKVCSRRLPVIPGNP